jgi:2-keto-4-pentenoate hydratase/2-oxohepta-3-ene-1,7-dioic acid hydratase in catechol pathway
MPTHAYALATVEHGGRPHACIEREGRFYPLAGRDLPDRLIDVLARWTELAPAVERAAAACGSGGWETSEVRVLTPLQYPGKVLCAGANYYDHLAEMGVKDLRKEAQRLFFFFKPPRNALVGPGRTVRYPRRTQMFDWEIELAAVIGRTAKDLAPETALDCVAGYTVGIDLSARDLNQAPETFYKLDWVAGKAQDTCCPLGPRIVPATLVGNAQDLALELKVNGETRQSARTAGMIFDIREQLVLLSSIMTLDPGDVLLTGTPAGVGFPKRTFLKPGDRIAATIESIGTLEVEIQ